MSNKDKLKKSSRRDFIHISSGVTVVAVACFSAWPLIDQMNPSADILSFSTIEVDLSLLKQGQSMSVLWRGKPLFIRYRTDDEIKEIIKSKQEGEGMKVIRTLDDKDYSTIILINNGVGRNLSRLMSELPNE